MTGNPFANLTDYRNQLESRVSSNSRDNPFGHVNQSDPENDKPPANPFGEPEDSDPGDGSPAPNPFGEPKTAASESMGKERNNMPRQPLVFDIETYVESRSDDDDDGCVLIPVHTVFPDYGDANRILFHRECCEVGFGTRLNIGGLTLWHFLHLIVGCVHDYRQRTYQFSNVTVFMRHEYFADNTFSIMWNLIMVMIFGACLVSICVPSLDLLMVKQCRYLSWGFMLAMLLDAVLYLMDGLMVLFQRKPNRPRAYHPILIDIRQLFSIVMTPTIISILLFYYIFLTLNSRKALELKVEPTGFSSE